ncbi:MAG: hypothetical protein ATN36_06735 [Epulopiscium sp. Nele67-Bin005]|nr:MAG: hypothetical protein ATN36_06735 [Epulopiscium sp. Nele67-Bin005]
MVFKNFRLLVNDEDITKRDIKKICKQGLSYVKDYGIQWYKVNKTFEEDRFLWLCCEYINPKIYNKNILDGDTNTELKNPRKPTQAELKEQLFVCYDTATHKLYLNDYKKKGFVTHYLSETLQKDVKIEKFRADAQDFQDTMNGVHHLHFNLTNTFGNVLCNSPFDKIMDIFEVEDHPSYISVEFNYHDKPSTQVLDKVALYEKWQRSDNFKKITVIGSDANNLVHNYDFIGIVKNIRISVKRENDGRFDPEVVKSEFLKKIR